ncbi:RTA1 like protein-domain-containing protein [Aspergillus keveii]|uniref:RTA1 like protein-domain-containing protein n=1 Tax=Aspergillus keveii TaxID=714993 RepID=A0ABR4G0R7_9EURO
MQTIIQNLPYTSKGSYGYQPSLCWGIVYTVIFGIIACAQTFHMIRNRVYWTFFFIVGAILEVIGWVGRTVSYSCPYSRTLFLLQTATLIMVLIRSLGRHVSPFPPKTDLFICSIIDVAYLTIQATGGGLAGAAYSSGASTQPGTTTMIAGVIAHLVAAVIFSFLLVFMKANRPLLNVALATVFATLMMIMRNVYKSIELSEGWRGYLITHERYVLALDALPMALCMGVFAVVNPGAQLGGQAGREEVRSFGMGERGTGSHGERTEKGVIERFLHL